MGRIEPLSLGHRVPSHALHGIHLRYPGAGQPVFHHVCHRRKKLTAPLQFTYNIPARTVALHVGARSLRIHQMQLLPSAHHHSSASPRKRPPLENRTVRCVDLNERHRAVRAEPHHIHIPSGRLQAFSLYTSFQQNLKRLLEAVAMDRCVVPHALRRFGFGKNFGRYRPILTNPTAPPVCQTHVSPRCFTRSIASAFKIVPAGIASPSDLHRAHQLARLNQLSSPICRQRSHPMLHRAQP